jgi:anti-sigma factor RsiW
VEVRETVSENPVNDDVMIAYLIGDLSAEEQSRLEEQYFVTDRVFEQLLAVEDELIDDYVRGDLSEPLRIRFERHFLESPERRRKLAFARSLEAYRSPTVRSIARSGSFTPVALGRWWGERFLGAGDAASRWVLGAAATALVLGAALLVIQNGRLRSDLRFVQAERATMREQEEKLRQRLDEAGADARQAVASDERQQREQSRGPVLPSVSLALIGGLVRSGGEQAMLVIPPGPHIVQLRVTLERDSYRTIRAAIETAEGSTVWSQETSNKGPRSEHATLSLALSSDVFQSDDYVLKLSGVGSNGAATEIDAFTFRVARH